MNIEDKNKLASLIAESSLSVQELLDIVAEQARFEGDDDIADKIDAIGVEETEFGFQPVTSVSEINIELYVSDVIDRMAETDSLAAYAFDIMIENIRRAPQEQLIQEYNSFYGE